MIYGIWDVLSPVFFYMILSNIMVFLSGNRLDAASLTTVTAVVTLPGLVWMYRKDRREAPEQKNQIPWWVYPFVAVSGVVLNILLTVVLNHFAVTEHFSNAAQEGLLASDIAAQILGLGILVPVMEEFLFRGLFYRRLKKYIPVWAAVLLGAAVFALYHGNMVQILFAFPMGLVMLLAYEKWDSLAVPVIFHMAVNLSTVIISII